jgi:tRNA threonylcarbamoyladenosine biosynthesis protein TsaB
MRTIFISTYCEKISIALLFNDKLISLKEKVANRSHSNYTVPLIDEILKENNLIPQNINSIIVIDGPGSFTGVRLGITVAKMLAYTLNIPIKCISSIEAIAISNDDYLKIVTISDSKGKYFGIFNNNIIEEPLMYLANDDFALYINNPKYQNYKVISNDKLDIEKINAYCKNIKEVNPHAVKARYIKELNLK